MTKYAILTVHPAWETSQSAGLSEAAAERWHDEMEIGARVLIFKGHPVDAIIAEAEYTGAMEDAEQWPADNVTRRMGSGTGTKVDYLLPLKIVYAYETLHYIPLSRIQTVLPDFAAVRDGWQALDVETYRMLSH